MTGMESWIVESIQAGKSNCVIELSIEQSIEFWSTKSIRYLRSYTDMSDLSIDDVEFVNAFLEAERGRYDRLCGIDNGRVFGDMEDPTDLEEVVAEWVEEESSEGNYCAIAKRLGDAAHDLWINNINYLRTYFDLPTLSPDYVTYLAAYWLDESEHYGGLCARQN